MNKRISFVLSLLLGFALAFIWWMQIAVAPNNAQTTTVEPSIDPDPRKTLMIVLDNSGSMGRCPEFDSKKQCQIDAEIPYKIDVVKEAVISRLSKINMSSTKLGLAEFGNYKDYGIEVRDRCEAVKTIIEPGLNNEAKIVKALQTEIKPNIEGVTPVSYAIGKTVIELKRKNLLPARILMISDGKANCGEDEDYYSFCGVIGSFVYADPKI